MISEAQYTQIVAATELKMNMQKGWVALCLRVVSLAPAGAHEFSEIAQMWQISKRALKGAGPLLREARENVGKKDRIELVTF